MALERLKAMAVEQLRPTARPDEQPRQTPWPEAEHRSLLGAALNIEYGPCSVAAAELARAASNLITHPPYDYQKLEKAQTGVTQIVTDSTFPSHRLLDTYPLYKKTDVEGEYSYSSNKTVHASQGISIVQNIEVTKEKIIEKVSSRKFGLRSVKEQEVLKEYESRGSVWQADEISGGRVLMPLAAFETRADGNCSYVQLGQEINDDSIFAVQSDEQTRRLQLIDDLRSVLAHPVSSEPLPKSIKAFIHSERERNAGQICAALGSWIGNYVAYGQETPRLRDDSASIIEMREGDSAVHFDVVKRGHVAQGLDIAGTNVSLSFVHQTDQAGQIDRTVFGALARGNVLFPIWEFYPQSGDGRCIAAEVPEDVDTYKALMVQAHLSVERWRHTDFSDELKSVAGANADPYHTILDTFRIPKLMRKHLRPECSSQEKLATALGKKTLENTYRGTVSDVNMNTTRASVTGSVIVERVGSVLQARIVAKPDALAAMQPEQIAAFAYDPTEPLVDQLPKGRDAEEFADLINGFSYET
jgi:hypothetical protein